MTNGLFPDEYQELLRAKIATAPESGFDPGNDAIHSSLFDHQRAIVRWACKGGCRAIFAAFGLGKTYMQLELLRLIVERLVHDGMKRKEGRGLIICPLGVKAEFARDAKALGIDIEYVRTTAEAEAAKPSILMTNYERVREGQIDPNLFVVVSLDEASVLRGYGTKTFQEFLPLMADVPYRFVCTATPSPNRYKELIHYAGFLGIMDTGQALTRFFQRDSTQANKLTLYPHMEEEFWTWMSSWACFVTTPGDLGFEHDDYRYTLPELHIHYHEIPVDHATAPMTKDGQGQLIRDSAASLRDAAKEKRDTIGPRIAKAREIIADSPNRHFILWHHLEAERREIEKTVDGSVSVYGSLDLETREQRIAAFADGEEKILATKPRINGSGCNLQRHCADAIFCGIDYKFNDFIQAVHRIYRFLQDSEVHIHVIYAESEEAILRELLAKWDRHKELIKIMAGIVRQFGLGGAKAQDRLVRAIGVDRQEVSGDLYRAVNADAVLECATMDTDSVHAICTSIPFGNHYEYSANCADLGHNLGNDEFFAQMDYLSPHLYRILKPGRVFACHVKDRILFGNVTGHAAPTVDPFHAMTIFHYLQHGFLFFGMVTIETDVVRENNQTYRLGWTEQCKDGTKMGVGCPEYLLLFRKPPTDLSDGFADVRVAKDKGEYPRARWQIDARAKWNTSGDRLLSPDEVRDLPLSTVNLHFAEYFRTHTYGYEQHVEYAGELDKNGKLPSTLEALSVPSQLDWIWSDVSRMRTLNGEQVRRALVNHICPLQFDIVDRVINRFTNRGEIVFDPFAGIMTVPYRAILKGRIGHGIELNEGYWRDGAKYLEAAEIKVSAPTLFDMEPELKSGTA